jgi:branched-chain amino acid aminotransferase
MAKHPVWVDGTLLHGDEARVSVLSHAIQRGSLVFDVGAMRETVAGGVACFRPREHIERFLRSTALVGLGVRWTVDQLLFATLETARASGASSALVRWSAYVPSIEADVVPRPTASASVAIALLTAEDYSDPGELWVGKPPVIRVTIPTDVVKAGPEVFPPQAKVSASYLGPMLAKRRALAAGYDEVVLLDREGLVAEAPTANVFAVRDGAIVTPPTERVLAGITRASLLDIARAEGIEAREAHLSKEQLVSADEAFLAGTSLPVQAIASIDGRPLGNAAPGPVTLRLKECLVRCERGADPRFSQWLVSVG